MNTDADPPPTDPGPPRREITVPALTCPYCRSLRSKAYKTVYSDALGKRQYRACGGCGRRFVANIIPQPISG